MFVVTGAHGHTGSVIGERRKRSRGWQKLTFESEELRQKWITSPDHIKVWPPMEALMKDTKNYTVLLCDAV